MKIIKRSGVEEAFDNKKIIAGKPFLSTAFRQLIYVICNGRLILIGETQECLNVRFLVVLF